jgi:5-methylcytosine-specific restriction endonuclease McrA
MYSAANSSPGAQMNFQNLSDTNLDQEMIASVKSETSATLRVLHLLREVERRRLFSKFKYQSLLDYAEKRLGYPYDQAWRRIQAMRLLKELPEIEQKISDGSLNLTNIGYAQAAFKAEAKNESPLNRVAKLEFLQRIENTSTRETQKLVAEQFGKEVLLRETVKPVSATISILNLIADEEFLTSIDELKGVFAHSHPGITTSELLKLICKEKLNECKTKRAGKIAAPRKCEDKNHQQVAETRKPASRYIRASVNREIWSRDGNQCTKCGSNHALERDHRIAFAKNGGNTADNLRLLCRNCNQRKAIEEFGLKKMGKYLKEQQLIYLG